MGDMVMAEGFEVYNADGSLQFDLNSRLMRLITTVPVGTAAGSTSIPAIPAGSTAVALVSAAGDNADNEREVTIGSGTMSWTTGNAGRIDLMVY